MFRLLVALALFSATTFAAAQTRFLASTEDTRKVSEGIVASVASGNTSGAIKTMRPLAVVPSTDLDVFEAQFNSQQQGVLRQFGAPSGYEFVREEKLGTRLLRQSFLVFHEKAPLRWNFVFYKQDKGWVLSHFAFDGNALGFF